MPFDGLLWHPQKTYPINVWFLLAYYQLTPRRLLECKHDIGKVLFFTYIHICIKITFIGWRLDTLRAFQVPVFQHSLCRWSLEVRYVPYCSYMVSNFGFMLTSDFGWNYTRKSTPCFLRHDMFEAQKCRTDDGHRLIFFLPDRGAKFVARKAIWRMYAPWRLHKNWDQVGGSPLGKILGELSEAEKFTICIGQLANLSSNALMYWYGRSYIPKSLGWRVSLQQISKNRKLNKYTHTHTRTHTHTHTHTRTHAHTHTRTHAHTHTRTHAHTHTRTHAHTHTRTHAHTHTRTHAHTHTRTHAHAHAHAHAHIHWSDKCSEISEGFWHVEHTAGAFSCLSLKKAVFFLCGLVILWLWDTFDEMRLMGLKSWWRFGNLLHAFIDVCYSCSVIIVVLLHSYHAIGMISILIIIVWFIILVSSPLTMSTSNMVVHYIISSIINTIITIMIINHHKHHWSWMIVMFDMMLVCHQINLL